MLKFYDVYPQISANIMLKFREQEVPGMYYEDIFYIPANREMGGSSVYFP